MGTPFPAVSAVDIPACPIVSEERMRDSESGEHGHDPSGGPRVASMSSSFCACQIAGSGIMSQVWRRAGRSRARPSLEVRRQRQDSRPSSLCKTRSRLAWWSILLTLWQKRLTYPFGLSPWIGPPLNRWCRPERPMRLLCKSTPLRSGESLTPSDTLLESRFHVFRKSTPHRDTRADFPLWEKKVGVERAGFPIQYLKKHDQIHLVVLPSWKAGFRDAQPGPARCGSSFTDGWASMTLPPQDKRGDRVVYPVDCYGLLGESLSKRAIGNCSIASTSVCKRLSVMGPVSAF